ncbi:MAG: mechanosensitive ion channel domain-containing protein [Dehalococcoidia bacterium]
MSGLGTLIAGGVQGLPGEAARIALTILAGGLLMVAVRRGLPWLTGRAVRAGIARLGTATADDRRRMSRRIATLEHFLTRTLQSLVVTATVMVVLAQLGVRVDALLASAGIAGIAIAFGSQAFVRDAISGLFILAQGPFDLGDYVRLNAVEGTVAQISLRSTTLITDDGVVHTVANGAIAQTSNYTRDAWSHVLTVSLKRTVPLALVQQAVAEVAAELAAAPELGDELVSGPTVRGITALHGASYDVEVRSVVGTALRARYPSLVLGRLVQSFERHDVELA